MPIDYDAIETNFSYHAPKADQPERYARIREQAKQLAILIYELCPDSAEKTIATRRIEEATMWANASIARNE